MSKVCSGCRETKELTEFWRRSDRKNGYVSRCKECRNKAQKEAYREEPKRADNRKQKLRINFGLSVEEYDSLSKKQGDVCAICKEPEKALSRLGHPKYLAVDHCHTTGKIRGLLCHNCNIGIGNLKDSVSLLKEAIDYLNRYEEEGL